MDILVTIFLRDVKTLESSLGTCAVIILTNLQIWLTRINWTFPHVYWFRAAKNYVIDPIEVLSLENEDPLGQWLVREHLDHTLKVLTTSFFSFLVSIRMFLETNSIQ